MQTIRGMIMTDFHIVITEISGTMIGMVGTGIISSIGHYTMTIIGGGMIPDMDGVIGTITIGGGIIRKTPMLYMFMPMVTLGLTIRPPTELIHPIEFFKSPDGSRVVKIYGSTRDAFLYDAQNVHAFHPIYLTSHVKKVEFSRPKPGHPLQIIVEKQNGTFEMFNAEGEAYTNSAF